MNSEHFLLLSGEGLFCAILGYSLRTCFIFSGGGLFWGPLARLEALVGAKWWGILAGFDCLVFSQIGFILTELC